MELTSSRQTVLLQLRLIRSVCLRARQQLPLLTGVFMGYVSESGLGGFSKSAANQRLRVDRGSVK